MKKVMKGKTISEYGGAEMYSSKSAMAKHEKKEGVKVEKKEEKTASKKMMGKKIVIKKKK